MNPFLLGCIGGAILETLKWTKFRFRHPDEIMPKSWIMYGILTLFLILMGGGTAALYQAELDVELGSLALIHIGASSPAIILGLTVALPSDNPGTSG